MRKTGKWLAIIMAALIMVCMALPAAAEEAAEETAVNTFTASNGVLSIELPSESWKEILDQAHWIVLSDGANMVTVDHYSNGEKLPEAAIADDHYVNVYQALFSTQNEVFIITGYAVDAEKIPDICNMIMSAKVLKYNTKQAVNKQSISVNEFSLEPVNKIMYTTEGINVRNGCSTTEQIIGGLAKGAAVNVIGKVLRNGKDYGWYQIEFNESIGYVSSSFITETGSSEAPDSSDISFTGSARTIYDANGNPLTVYESTDGYWYDSSGRQYSWVTTYEFARINGNGEMYSVNKPIGADSGLYPTGDSTTAFWLNGRPITLTPYSDGSYYSPDNWVQYWDNGNGTYSGSDGSTIYIEEVPLGNDAVVPLYSQGSGRPVVITYTDDGIYDAEGNQYYEQSDGTYLDDYGAVYDDDYSPYDPY